MSDQLQLEFRVAPTNPNVGELVDLLRAHGAWMTAQEITTSKGWGDRTIRAYAEAAAPDVISGNLGYKHLHHATAEEVQQTCNRLEHQAKRMLQRVESIRLHTLV